MAEDLDGPDTQERDQTCAAAAGGGGMANDVPGPRSPVMRADSVPVVSFGAVPTASQSMASR
jgi:hypothetical protein